MIELYADFNDIAADGTLPLTAEGSVAAIAALGAHLREAQRVRLSDGELVTLATVHQRDDGTWEARSNWEFFEAPQR